MQHKGVLLQKKINMSFADCRLSHSRLWVSIRPVEDPLVEISLLTKVVFFCGLDLRAGTNVLCIMPVLEMRNKKTSAL